MSLQPLRTRYRVHSNWYRVRVLVAGTLTTIIPRGALAQRLVQPNGNPASPSSLTLTAPARADSSDAVRLLAAVQQLARSASPLLLSARAQRDAARARAAATGFTAPATLTAGLSEAPNGDPTQGNLRLEVGREMFTARRRRAERDLANTGVLSADAAVRTAEREVDAAVLREAIHASAWHSVAARLAAEDQLLSGADESVRSRFAVGAAQYVDVLRLRTERLRVQTERAAALSELRASRAALAGLLGDRATDAAVALDSLVLLQTRDSDGGVIATWRGVLAKVPDLASLLDSAGDVRVADATLRQARAEQLLGIAQRRSQVSAYAGVQRIGQANNGPAFGPSLGVTMTLPFTASRATALAVQADLRGVDAADVNRRSVVAATRTRLAMAAARLDAARERLTVFDAALLRGAREERESALAAYRTGGLTLLDFVDFERALARAEIDRVRALIDAADAYADLLTGGGNAATSLPLTLIAPDRR